MRLIFCAVVPVTEINNMRAGCLRKCLFSYFLKINNFVFRENFLEFREIFAKHEIFAKLKEKYFREIAKHFN